MANVNKVMLLGNLTRDVEVRYNQGGTAIGKFGMAINRTYTVNGEKKDSTCFVDCTAWGKQAEVMGQYLAKGRAVFVEGRLEFSQWEKDGAKRSKLEVIVENFQFLGGKGDAGGDHTPAHQRAKEADPAEFGGIPF